MTFKEFYDAAHAVAPDCCWLSVKVETVIEIEGNYQPLYSIYDADREQSFTTFSPEECLEVFKKSFSVEDIPDIEISDSTKEMGSGFDIYVKDNNDLHFHENDNVDYGKESDIPPLLDL